MAETEAPTASSIGRPRSCWQPLLSISSFLLASFLAISLQTIFLSPISPHPLLLPSPSTFPINNFLQGVSKIGEGFLKDPEDICVDEEKGILYTATRDGWIKRLHPNGSWENWKNFETPTLLGITTSKHGGIIVCDSQKGLLKVNEDGFSILASSHVNETMSIRFADDVVEAADGTLYFSDASTKFGLHNWFLDYLEAKPHGRLLKFDHSSNQTSILLDHLYFANGVALSKLQDYLIICETFKYRCLKYWLKGEKEGQSEIFAENLPGGPDNVNPASDGSFWIALIQLHREGWEVVFTSKILRHIVATFPKLYEFVSGVRTKATVVNVAADGSIIRKLDDPTGKVMSFVTSAVEFQDHLYFGSLNSNFIGKLPLDLIVAADEKNDPSLQRSSKSSTKTIIILRCILIIGAPSVIKLH